MRSFTIATDRIGSRGAGAGCVCTTTSTRLRAAAQRLNPKPPGTGWADTFGCFQPSSFWTNKQGFVWWHPNGYAGTLRLAEGYVMAEIVAHELVHAAVQIYRMNVRRRVQLGVETGQREEDLAYIYGELFADLQDKLEAAR